MTERQGIEIEYCPNCRGVWLDRGESRQQWNCPHYVCQSGIRFAMQHDAFA
jgi:Transcription factor zinc-finger